ncbi:P-loop NTPase fold protein [Parafrigoribacterium soli]|uniref:P-loop NTPase fold protein n=1 Tax=Parafrigoribacterium soli TaxID=3144663 RepID=UPI0032EE1FF0
MLTDDAKSDWTPWFFPDVPVSTEEADSFGHRDLANNLETAIRFNQGRVMIGLLGGFGVGKSSVIRLLEGRLAGDRTVLRISAERHEIPVFHRAFVFAFAEAVERARLLSRDKIETELEVLSYSSTHQLTDWRLSPAVRVLSRLVGKIGSSLARRALALSGLAAVVTVILFVVLLGFGVPVAQEIWTWLIGLLAVATATPVIAVLISLVSGHGLAALGSAIKPGIVNRLRPRVEAADEYERVFANLVQLIPEEIVIAIDDVDRLSAKDVLPALNAIRSFQLTCARQPAFIVSADEEVIARAIRESSPSLAGVGDGDDAIVAEYLSRLFTHRQQMPPHAFADLRAYARQLLTSPPHPTLGKLAPDLDSIIQVLVYDGVKNPRHVIRLVNAFLADYRLATLREQRSGVQSMKDGTVTGNPKALARLAVLRLDFPRFYRVFATDTPLLIRIEDVARADAEDDTAKAIAEKIGISDPEGAEYKALEAYVARTAGWVEDVDDLLPFIYLGQDEIDRAVGSATARRVRSILTNGLTADFLAYLDEPSEEEDAAGAFALVRSTVEELTGPELSNALTVLDGGAAMTSAEKWMPGLAESFATSVKRAPAPDLSVRGLSRLAAAASGAQRTTILDVLLGRGQSDLTWSLALIENRPAMDPAIGGSAQMNSRIESALALLGHSGDVTQLAQIGSAVTDSSNSAVATAALRAHLEVLAREQDATEDIRATVARLTPVAARSLSLPTVVQVLGKMISEPGSVSSAVAFDVLSAMDLTDPKSLAGLGFDIALNSVSTDDFVDGVDEDYLAGCAPVLLAALKHSSKWTRPVDGEKVPLPRAVAQLLALGTQQFSWIDGFTEPLSASLRAFPAELSPVVEVIARAFENYTTQSSPQREWDLIVSTLDELQATDRQLLIDTLVRMLGSDDDAVRAIAVGKLPAFLRTVNGAASADAMAASLESGLTRTTAHLLDALEVLLDAPGVAVARQQSVAQNIANILLPYPAVRPAGIAALCSISWQPAVRLLVAQWLAGYPAEISKDQVLEFARPMEPLAAPPVFAPVLENAAAAALSEGDARTAAAAVGNLSPALTAAVAVQSTDAIDGALRAWLHDLVGQRDEAIDALFAVVGDEALDPATVKRVVAAYAESDQEAFDARVIALVQDELVEHIRSVSGRGWTLLLERAGDGVVDGVADVIVAAWTSGSSSDVVATAGPGSAAASMSQLDVKLSSQIPTALQRWTVATPNDAAAAALGAIARVGTQLAKAARRELDRPGPRKNAASRAAFRKAKSAFGLKV